MANFRPAAVREMTEPERAWVGAFIEADGCVYWRKNHKHKIPCITVSQKEVEPISTLLRFTGVGTISRHKAGCWLWNVQCLADVQRIAEMCADYCPKLQQNLDLRPSEPFQ